MGDMKRILIVGGGITGLTAAYYLQKEIRANQLPYEVKLVESTHRLGGKVKTYKRDGFTIEQGPDSFLERKTPAVKLVESLGIQDQLVRNGTGQSYILVGDKLHKMPKGSFMGIPMKKRPFLLSGITSWKGKMRAGLDLTLSKGKTGTDQSLGAFLRRRFGNELVENQLEPLLSGIYAGDVDNMSLMATFPNFYQLEQEYGSLIKGLRETKSDASKQKKKKTGQFLSFADGLQTLIDALQTQLGDSVQLNTAVDHIEKKTNGYHVLLDSGEVYKADTVIMTTPHDKVPRIFSQYDFLKTFHDMPSTSVATVAMAFDQSAIQQDIDGTGFVVSRNSDFRITACTWTHKKWPATTPDGKVLLRCYVGRPNDQSVVDLTDSEIEDIVLHDLNKTMNITQKPEFSVVSRWKNAMPQYTVGHTERIAQIRGEAAKQLPGVFLTGSSYEGIGLPDCIAQGEKAVADVLRFLE